MTIQKLLKLEIKFYLAILDILQKKKVGSNESSFLMCLIYYMANR